MRYLSVSVTTLMVLLFIFTSCKKNKPLPEPTPPVIDLSGVQLTDFRFSEVNYTSITITHPIIVNGEETTPGVITIKIPYGSTGLQLTPLTANFQKAGFTISPQLGVKTDYLFKEVLYSIVSESNPQKKVHYRVTVQQEPAPGPLAITNFRFLKSMNSQLSEDIYAAQILEQSGTISKIHVFVPEGTHLGALTAVIDHNGDELRYTQSSFEVPANSSKIYPSNGLSIDYSYPRVFYIAVKRGDEAHTYAVLVDVEKPIVFVESYANITGLQSGITQTIKVGELYNRGNRRMTINQIIHSDHVPEYSDLRTFVTVPSGGILPGAKVDIFTTLTAGFFFPGTYQVKALMRPTFFQQPEMQNFLQPSVFNLKIQLQ